MRPLKFRLEIADKAFGHDRSSSPRGRAQIGSHYFARNSEVHFDTTDVIIRGSPSRCRNLLRG
jgi:hypothetical protein